jgi:hypothetical protein
VGEDEEEIENEEVDDADDDEEEMDENDAVEKSEDEEESSLLSHFGLHKQTEGYDESEQNQSSQKERKRTSSCTSSLPFRRCLLRDWTCSSSDLRLPRFL